MRRITGNTITNIAATGIYLWHSNNNMLIGNTITNNPYGIWLYCSNNNTIQSNTVTNIDHYGIALTSSNNNTIQNNKITNNSWMGIELSHSNDNTIQNNNITDNTWYGIHLGNSNNIIITKNTITNSIYGINPQNSNVTIQFNRITGCSSFGIVNQAGSVVNAQNNWWGTNTPSYTTTWQTPYNIYVEGGTVTYNPWLVLSFDEDSCTGSGNNFAIVADLTHNNQGEDTSSNGHVPNGIPVNFTTNVGTIISPAYTVKGKASTILNVGNTQNNLVNISSSVDGQSINAQIMTSIGSASLLIRSTALDNSTGQMLDVLYASPLNDSVSWVSVLWKNTGLFQEEMNLIINGNVVMNKTLINSAYRTYKNSYSQQVFNQINYFNALFANSAEADLLLQTLIVNNPQLQNLTGTQFIDGILDVIKQNNNFTDSEINFIKNNYLNFTDSMLIHLYYPGKPGQNINITDPETNKTMNLNFPGNLMSMICPIMYRNGSFVSQHLDSNNNTYVVIEPAGYEGVRSFAIATTKVNNNVLQYWLSKASIYQPGAMKAAYGTFMTALLVEYCHDRIAENVTSQFNVTWARTAPIAVSAGDDAHLTYLTLMCDHSMGMTVTGLPEDMAAFHFACSSVISAIEQNVMKELWFNYQFNSPTSGPVGSVMTDMVNAFMNGTPLEAYESNGYVILKAVGRNDLIFVIDPETGVVRDMNTANGFCGSYCYYDLQTELALSLGNSLVNTAPAWLSNINEAGLKGWKIIDPRSDEDKQFEKETRAKITLGGGDIKGPLRLGVGILTVFIGIGKIYQLFYDIEKARNEYGTIPEKNTTKWIFNATKNTTNITELNIKITRSDY